MIENVSFEKYQKENAVLKNDRNKQYCTAKLKSTNIKNFCLYWNKAYNFAEHDYPVRNITVEILIFIS